MDSSSGHPFDAFVAQTRALNGTIIRERESWNSLITADAIRHFCQGIGDDHPRWLSGPKLTAPPTFLTSVLYPVVHGAPMELPLASLILDLEFQWHRTLAAGYRLQGIARQKDAFETKQGDGSRALCIAAETEYYQSGGQCVAKANATMMRILRDGGDHQRLRLVDRPIYQYTPDELNVIGEALRQETETRLTDGRERFGDQVEPGAALPELVRGPLTIGDMICWQAAIGPAYRAGPLGYRDGLAAPHTLVRNPVTGWRVKYSQEHEDFLLASNRGMPAPFDNGVMRFAWVSPLLTNWMGPSGFLRRLAIQVLAPNLYGDTTWYRGTVTRKSAPAEHEGACGVSVQIAITGTNQLGEKTTLGEAEVFLPIRAQARIHSPHPVSLSGENSEPVDGIENRCLHDLVERRLRERPATTALVCSGRSIDGQGLRDRIRALARRLRECKVDLGTIAGVCLDRSSPDLVPSLAAVLCAGGAYMPIDPVLPAARLHYFLADAKPRVIVTDRALAPVIAKAVQDLPLQIIHVDADQTVPAETPELSGAASRPAPAGDSPAYLLYTSGSTARPKGVLVPHASLSVYIQSLSRALPVEPGDVCLQTALLSFSAAVRQIWLPLFVGATLVVADREQVADTVALFSLIKERSVTVWDTVPSVLSATIRALRKIDSKTRAELLNNSLRLILITGEPLRWSTVRAWREELGRKTTHIISLYSQTETVGTVCCYPVPEQPGPALGMGGGFVPLGRPIDNTGIHLLDDTFTPVVDDGPGEICVSGPRLASGYFNQPALTAERFVTPSKGELSGVRLYRTHDQGRRRSDGVIEYLGRLDAQLKIRGHRISPAEVELAIMAHPDVSEAVVGAEQDRAGESVLVAWVAPVEVRSPIVEGRHRYRLPNNLAVAHCNRHETDFGYQAIFEEQTYLKHGISLRDGDCIFDVGANIGLFALFANLMCVSPTLFCFEPNPDVFQVLELNTRLYAVNARLFPLGLSDVEKMGRFTAFSGSTIQSGFYADAESEREIMRNVFRNQAVNGRPEMDEILDVSDELINRRFLFRQVPLPLRTLSSVIEEYRVETIDLLKVNAEKSELDVLRGIRNRDWGKIRQVVIKSDMSDQKDAIISLLERQGFETADDQDELMRHTPVRTLYGIRPSEGRRRPPALSREAYRQPVPRLDEPFLTETSLREMLRANLPYYMVPARFHFCEQLPRTLAGKVDRLALGRKSAALDENQVASEPAETVDSVEGSLKAEWCDLLGVDRAGLEDDFFDSGGDSLKAVELLATVRGLFNTAVSLRDFLRQPTIAGLIRIIERDRNVGTGHAPAVDQLDLPEKIQKLDDGF